MRVLGLTCACLVVAAAAAAQNLLTNPSFNGSLDGWTYDGAVTSYDASVDATGVSGSGSAKAVIPPSSGGGVFHQYIPVSGSRQYKLGGKVLIPPGQAADAKAYFSMQFFSDNTCSSGWLRMLNTGYVTVTGTWVAGDTGFVTMPANAGCVVVAAALQNGHGATQSFQANFDDMFFIAGEYSYARWIPAVIHKDVPSKNAKWRSDVAILNRSTSTANVTITMHLNSGPVSQTTQLAGSSQLLQADVAGWLGVTTDSGPLEVTSDQEFFLSGRTYNQVDEAHTYGQNYEGEEPSDLLAAEESAWLPQLTENSLYRTNIGITNTGPEGANVSVTLYDASGNQVWSDTRDYLAGGFYQYQQPYQPYGGIASGYARVTVNWGSGVVAYASVVDGNTGDPTTITMKR